MNESYNRRRPRLEDVRERNDSGRKRGFFLTGFQTVICVIGLAAVVALKQFGGQYYVTAKSYVENALQNNITSEEVSEALHSIGEKLPDAAEIFSSGVISSSNAQNGAHSGTTSETSGSSQSEPASSSSSSAAVSSLQPVTGSSSAAALPAEA
jgi:hypothetical protein